MLNKFIIVCVTVSVMSVSGCARTHLNKDFGVANVHNIDQQTVNPEAYKKDVVHTLSGEKAQKVIDGYNKEKPAASSQNLLKDASSN